jgi:hypothetical protein
MTFEISDDRIHQPIMKTTKDTAALLASVALAILSAVGNPAETSHNPSHVLENAH